MNEQTEAKVVVLSVITVLLLVAGSIAYGLGRYIQPAEQVVKFRECSARTKYVAISDRLTACEEKGGKYSLYWSELYERHIEVCKRTDLYITDF
jgi:hypothetical protein